MQQVGRVYILPSFPLLRKFNVANPGWMVYELVKNLDSLVLQGSQPSKMGGGNNSTAAHPANIVLLTIISVHITTTTTTATTTLSLSLCLLACSCSATPAEPSPPISRNLTGEAESFIGCLSFHPTNTIISLMDKSQ